jgi:hypothetical protein
MSFITKTYEEYFAFVRNESMAKVLFANQNKIYDPETSDEVG